MQERADDGRAPLTLIWDRPTLNPENPTFHTLAHLGQRVGVGEVQERAEDGRAHVADHDDALRALAHAAVEQRRKHGRARRKDDAVRAQLLVLDLPVKGVRDSLEFRVQGCSSGRIRSARQDISPPG